MATVSNITPDEIKAIFPTTLDETSLTAFIETGTILFNEIFADVDYSDDRSRAIALFLISHLASVASPRVESERMTDYSYKVMGKTGEGLRSTFYGQNALLLDTNGTLESLGKQRAKMSAFDLRSR